MYYVYQYGIGSELTYLKDNLKEFKSIIICNSNLTKINLHINEFLKMGGLEDKGIFAVLTEYPKSDTKEEERKSSLFQTLKFKILNIPLLHDNKKKENSKMYLSEAKKLLNFPENYKILEDLTDQKLKEIVEFNFLGF